MANTKTADTLTTSAKTADAALAAANAAAMGQSNARPVEQFDKEFQRYVTKHGPKGAQAVAMARAELAKYRALVWQDKKLEESKVKQGRLSAAQRQAYEKKIDEIEKALDQFHHSVAGYNKTKAMLSFALLVAFALLAVFQPWKKFL